MDIVQNNNNSNKRSVNFRLLEYEPSKDEGIDLVFSREAVHETSKRFACTIFGYFIGNRLQFPVVERYVGNVWKKYGLKKAMQGFITSNSHLKNYQSIGGR